MSRKNKDALVVGLALFAMFFGAGNLIFPPYLGLQSGKAWPIAMLGFFLTGIGMPLLGIMAILKSGGNIHKLCNKVSPSFSKILGTIIVCCIGPFLAIPRTGATTFEMGIKPLFPGVNTILFSIIYFSITLFFVIKPSKVIDNIGKILTPILLIILSIIIVKGIKSPIAVPSKPFTYNSFSNGFIDGYQTMDAISSILMASIVLKSIAEKGYKESKLQSNIVVKAALIAGIGLAFVYGGLLYIGATVDTLFPKDINKAKLIMEITKNMLGSFGTIALSICVTLACLTTSIGLTAITGNYFNELSKGKLSYKSVVIITTIISALLSNIGVEKIIKVSLPVLSAIYPVTIVLIIMNIFDNLIPNKNAYRGAVYGALIVSLFNAVSDLGFNTYFVGKFINTLPLAEQRFSWIFPALIGAILFSILKKNKKLER